MKSARTTTVSIALLSGAVVLLLIAVVQLNALEKRASVQERQLRALGESTEKLAGAVGRLKAGGVSGGPSAAQANGCETDEFLHPEVENFLKPRELSWPPAGASLDGVLKRGWWYGDPKGFNWMVENAAELQEEIQHYVDLPIALRNKYANPDEWHGEAACRVEITDDYKEYTIYLRKGLMWHKPAGVDLQNPRYAWLDKEHELTADDFVFVIEMLKNPQVENGFLKGYFEDLDTAEAVNKHTLRVRWKKKTFQSLDMTLTLWPLPRFLFAYAEDGQPFPKETIGLRFNQHWYNNKGYVGIGPYRMEEYQPGVRMRLVRNEEFVGDKPAIKEIIYPIYTDLNVSVLKLKSKELNFVYLRPGQYREAYLDWQSKPKASWPKDDPFLNGKITCQAVNDPGYRYIGWNADKPLFADRRVRTALTYAFNRPQILSKVFLGLGLLTSGMFAPDSPKMDPSIQPLPFDLGKARALLEEAGWKDTDADGLVDKLIGGKRTPFEFSLLIVSSSPESSALANIFKEDLLKIGVKLEVRSVEWSLMQKRMDEKNFDAFTGAWTSAWDTDPFQMFHSSQADIPKGSNRVGFRNKEADKIMEQLRVTFPTAEREMLYRRFHRILHEEQPYSFFSTFQRAYCWRRDVKNVIFPKDRPVTDSRPWSVDARE